MATIALPSNYRVKRARAGYLRAQGMNMSPYSLQQRVHSFGGQRKQVEVTVPPIAESEADDWTQFFDSCNGMVNTFNLDVSDLYPHETGLTSVAFRLMEPSIFWDVSEAMHFGFSFVAIEV